MNEENKVTTVEEVRQMAKDTVYDSLYQYSLTADEKGEKAKGLAELYDKVVTDENKQKEMKYDLIGKGFIGAGSIIAAGIHVLLYCRSTRKEESGEIYATTTDRTVVTAILNKIFRK